MLPVLVVLLAFQDTSASISGRVLDHDNKPFAYAQVEVRGVTLAWADAQGRYRVPRVPPGTHHLIVRAIGYLPSDVVVVLKPKQRLTKDLVVGPTFVETGPDLPISVLPDSTIATMGLLDSFALGLVKTDTASAFTYERFGIRLLRAAVAASTPDSSRVLSPLSAGLALALALSAARDSTALALERGLELSRLGEAGLAARNQRFNTSLRRRSDVTLDVANALWVDITQTLQQDFARRARERYGATVRSVALHLPSVIGVMNHWADSLTRGKIRSIRDRKFDSSEVVVLTNAVYFKGRWLEAFDSAVTVERPFTTPSGERIPVPMMERTSNLAYRRADGFQVLRVAYKAGLTAMYIVLPDSSRTPASLLPALEQSGWPVPDPHRETRTVQLRFPKLHIEQATNLRPPLTAMGMGIIFDTLRSDFGKLVERGPHDPPECPPLSSGIHLEVCIRHSVSEAQQNVYLDVDEQGTEAAAVTTIGMRIVVTSAPPPPIPFFVDRPFLFALRDERTGTLLFVGLIAGPRH